MYLAQVEDGRAISVVGGVTMLTLRIYGGDVRGHPREWEIQDELALEPNEARDLIRAIEAELDRSGLA